MTDIALLVCRIVFVACAFLFLFAVMKTGIGRVSGQRKTQKSWTLTVEEGPRELRGTRLLVNGPVIVGRASGCDIVISTDFVSARHAKFFLMGTALMVEDLGSTNGTLVNDQAIRDITALTNEDLVNIGDVLIRARFS